MMSFGVKPRKSASAGLLFLTRVVLAKTRTVRAKPKAVNVESGALMSNSQPLMCVMPGTLIGALT